MFSHWNGAWVQLMLDKCTGWPVAIEISLRYYSPISAGAKLRLPSVTKAQNKEVDRLQDKMCPGLVKRLIAATKKGSVGQRSAAWEHCKFASWKVISKREWTNGLWSNAFALTVYRLLVDGGQPHGVARTLARLVMQRTRLNEKEGEMLRVRSDSRTVFVRGTEVVVSASNLLVDNKSVANVKNGLFWPPVYVVTICISSVYEISRSRTPRPRIFVDNISGEQPTQADKPFCSLGLQLSTPVDNTSLFPSVIWPNTYPSFP